MDRATALLGRHTSLYQVRRLSRDRDSAPRFGLPQAFAAFRQRSGETRHDAAQLIQIRLTDIPSYFIRPRMLGKLDRAQGSSATRCDADQFRPLMHGVVHVLSKPISFEQVGHPLNALAGQAELTCDLDDGRRLSLDHLERKPASQGLATGGGDCLAGAAEMSFELDHGNDQLGQGVAGAGAPGCLDSILSFC